MSFDETLSFALRWSILLALPVLIITSRARRPKFNSGEGLPDAVASRSCSKGTIERVPPELLSMIIAMVDDDTSQLACALVSHLWHTLTIPFLYRGLSTNIVPRDEYVRAAKQANPSLPEVHTLVTLFTKLIHSPKVTPHIHFLALSIAPPPPDLENPVQYLDSTYGVDPTSLCAIMESVPNLDRLILNDVFLSRPVRADEIGAAPRLKALMCLFRNCSNRRSPAGTDLLDILKLFKGVEVLNIVSCCDDGPPAPDLLPSATADHLLHQLGTTRLHFSDTIGPEKIMATLAPFPGRLTELTVNVVTHSTLLWIGAAATDLCNTLRVLNMTAYPVVLEDSGDVSAFRVFAGHTWPHLEELVFNLLFVPGELWSRTWLSYIELVRPLGSSSSPAFKRLYLSVGEGLEKCTFKAKVIRLLELTNILCELDQCLVRLADETSFSMLTICIWATRIIPTTAFTPNMLELDKLYGDLLPPFLPLLEGRGMLTYGDYSGVHTARLMADFS